MLTIKEVAEELKMSESFVYRLVASGEIPSYRLGRSKRIREVDLEEFLSLHKDGSQAVPRSTKRHF